MTLIIMVYQLATVFLLAFIPDDTLFLSLLPLFSFTSRTKRNKVVQVNHVIIG
jgi:hypothetical protein